MEQIAQRLGLRSHAVRHAIRALDEALGTYPLCWTNPFLRGQVPYRVYFSVDPSSGKRLGSFIERLTAQPEVAWLASLIGRYQFAMGVRGRGLGGLFSVFDSLDAEFGGIVTERNISPILSLAQFVPWLAHVGPGKRNAWQYTVAEPDNHIDSVDEKILAELQRRPLAAAKTIGKDCGLPPSTVAYRTERMVKDGVIIGFATSYDVRLVGREGIVISVATRGLAGREYDEFFELARRHPQVGWVARMLGERDVEFGATLDDVKQLNDLAKEIYAAGKGVVRDVQSHAIVKTFKD